MERVSGAEASLSPAASAPAAGGLSVYVGYAEDKETNNPAPATSPVLWAGAANTTFLGSTVPGQTACGTLTVCYDTGAIRLDNRGLLPVTVDCVDVDMHSSLPGGKRFSNLWGSFTVNPGQSTILAANPPANNPAHDNFDTSGYPGNQCNRSPSPRPSPSPSAARQPRRRTPLAAKHRHRRRLPDLR